MGRESRVRRSRQLKSSDFVVFANADEAKQEAKLVSIADRLGLVLPMIRKPSVTLVRLPDDD